MHHACPCPVCSYMAISQPQTWIWATPCISLVLLSRTDWDVCQFQLWTKGGASAVSHRAEAWRNKAHSGTHHRYRENFTVFAIWTLVCRELFAVRISHQQCIDWTIPCVSKKTIHFWNGGQIKNIRFWGEKIICMDSLWTQLSYDTKPLKIIHAWMSTAHSCKGYGN